MAKKPNNDFARECEGIIAEMVETAKQLHTAEAEHEDIETARKEAVAKVTNLANRHTQLKTTLHEVVDRHVAENE